MLITIQLLEKLGACKDEKRVFCSLWPDGVKVTMENARIAVNLGLTVNWLASKCSPTPEAFAGYHHRYNQILDKMICERNMIPNSARSYEREYELSRIRQEYHEAVAKNFFEFMTMEVKSVDHIGSS